ncbi:Uncharacterized protein TPAR_07801 [Tolypocladium paradoxum]|uniref:Uncharacterized protein n=1 Tax=Tolypocladium paradoxum TaxID=94208 RepID=A0A2S4KP79_9HYPO|nr:Uncharacterized protein TPAR_07801 [Tolypocladium paradoxum]
MLEPCVQTGLGPTRALRVLVCTGAVELRQGANSRRVSRSRLAWFRTRAEFDKQARRKDDIGLPNCGRKQSTESRGRSCQGVHCPWLKESIAFGEAACRQSRQRDQGGIAALRAAGKCFPSAHGLGMAFFINRKFALGQPPAPNLSPHPDQDSSLPCHASSGVRASHLHITFPGMDHLSDCSPRRSNRAPLRPKLDKRGRNVAPRASHRSTDPDAGADHVQAWLSQIPAASCDESPGPPNPEIDAGPSKHPWRPHCLPLPGISPTRQAAREAMYRQSPDLLVRDRPLSSISSRQSGEQGAVSSRSGFADDADRRRQKKRSRVPSEPSVSPTESREEAFCKRPRRRTRHDRYETKKHTEGRGETDAREQPRSKRRKDRRKQVLRCGREVMNNFASDAVSNQRVTMKPNLTIGLFLNGRSSTPAQHLTFHDMDFADRSKGADETKRLSKSRSKDQRRRERELQEESDFFTNVTSRKRQRPRSTSCASSPRRPPSPVIVIGSEHADTASIDGTGHGRSTDQTVPVSLPRVDHKRGARMQQMEDSTKSSSPISRSSRHRSLRIRLEPAESGSEAGHSPRMASEDSHLDELLQTGVFDHTGIPPRRIAKSHSGQDEQRLFVSNGRQHVKDLQKYSNANTQTANYQDKGVMVSPWSDSQRGLPPSDSARQTRDLPGSGHSRPSSVIRMIQRLNEVGTEHSKKPESRVGGTTDSIPRQCRPTQTIGAGSEAPYQPNNRGGHDANPDCLRAELPWNQSPFAQEGDSGAEKPAIIVDDSAFQQASRDPSQASPIYSSPLGFGGHSYFRFSGNRPRVQALRGGMPPLQENGRPWTSGGGMPIHGTLLPASLQGQPFFSTSHDSRVSKLCRSRSAESVDNEVAESETLQEFIARIEDEVLGQDEADTYPGQDGEELDAGDDFLDKRAVDSQLQGSRFDVDEPNYSHIEVSRTLGVGDGFAPVTDHGAAAWSGTPGVRQPTASQPWHNAHSLEDGDMVGFWRPNRLM